MSATIWNGESRSLSIETGKKLTVAAMNGTYSVLTTAGAGAGTALATNATGGTYGPYAGPITVLLSSSAISEIDFDVAVTPVIESDTFVKASKTLTGGISVYGQVVVPGLVADDSSASVATSNTNLIQAALNSAGDIACAGPGVIYVNNTLSLKSNTTLNILNGTTIKATPTMGEVMFVNASYSATPVSIAAAALTSSGTLATLAVAGIELLYPVNSYVFITGANEQSYNGVWKVTAASSGSISWQMENPATATPATGAITHRAAETNIQITGGGTIDYDGLVNSSASTLYNASACIFFGCDTPSVENVFFKNAKKYTTWFTAVTNASAKRLRMNTLSDGVHVCGPSRGVVTIDQLSGYCGDDIVGLSNGDNPTGELSRGEISHVRISNITGENSAISLVSIAGGGSSTIRYKTVEIDGVYGTCQAAPINVYEYVTGGATLHTTYIENLSIKNVSPSAWKNGAIIEIGGSTNGATVETLSIENLKPLAPMTGAQASVVVLQKAVVGRAVVRGLAGTFAASSIGHYVWAQDTATIGNLEIAEFDTVPVNNSKNALFSSGGSCTVGRVSLRGGRHKANTQGYLLNIGSACDVFLTDVYSSSPNSSVVVAAAVAINLFTKNWRHVGGYPVLGVAGSTISWEGDISTTATVAATSGAWGYINGPTIKIDANANAPTSPRPGDQFWNTNASFAGSASIGLKGRTNAGAWAAIF